MIYKYVWKHVIGAEENKRIYFLKDVEAISYLYYLQR